MKVLLFHPVHLPPRDYGGVERVVLWLARGLQERGHEVWIAAREGSRLPEGVRLVGMPEGSLSAHDLIERLPAGLDVVHFMAPPEPGAWEELPCPAVLTVHGNGKEGETFPRNTVFLSADHARRHGARTFVHNGIDPSEYLFSPESKTPWALFLSKTSWRVKNVKGAARLCGLARLPLVVAGGNRPIGLRLRSWFSPRLRWAGPVGGESKARLLAAARALIFPVLWPEPFGLVVAEALISGTPVIAAPRGSLPELLGPEVGALPATEEEWLEQLARLREKNPWSPEVCREWALKKFHYRKMAEDYETLFRRVLAGEQLQSVEPKATDWRTA